MSPTRKITTDMELHFTAIKDYYGTRLKTNQDLKSNACCPTGTLSPALRRAIADLHPEVLEKFYGCGSPIPLALDGRSILDLGSGSGRDCFLLSRMVGKKGQVVGIDMTPSQLAVARRHLDYHMKLFGFSKPNLEFRLGYMENLKKAGIDDSSMDIVISNCVINLSPAKDRVFTEIFRVLKPGGELYFSDIFVDRRMDTALAGDPVLAGECLGGALYFEDFRRLMARVGWQDFRIVEKRELTIGSEEVRQKIGETRFFSMTIRAFKLPLEDRCEDYGQVAWYLGTIPDSPHSFTLDNHHHFIAHRPHLVCGNTADMLQKTRFSRCFRVEGDRTRHFGLFPCQPNPEGDTLSGGEGSCC